MTGHPHPKDFVRLLHLVAEAEERGDIGQRARLIDQARALAPHHPAANRLLGSSHRAEGRLEDAERAFLAALGQSGGGALGANTRLALGECRLAMGRYDPETWAQYEERRGCWGYADPELSAPEWAGENLAGKHLVVLPEQGLGDQIQFARFAPWLQATTGARVTLVCDELLVRLFAGLGVQVRGEMAFMFDVGTHRAADAWVFTMSVPAKAGVTLERLPARPYLSASPVVGPAAKRIGVMTKGNPVHANDRHRSMSPDAAAELLALPGAVSLDPADTGAWDFADTAAIIAGLDLVISVDTSVAHLAGAMGKPVWVLLPAHGTDWRWMQGRQTSPWYPSARLYRQEEAGDWAGVLSRVRRDLSERAAA